MFKNMRVNPWYLFILLEGLQLGAILSLMERIVIAKISDGKEQQWKSQRNREVMKLQGG
jgi:hypothetical protein